MLSDSTALLVMRVWVERGSLRPLHAYIRETSDVSLGFERFSTVTDVDAALRIIRAWLDQVLEAAPLDDVSAAPLLRERPVTAG